MKKSTIHQKMVKKKSFNKENIIGLKQDSEENNA